MSTRCAGKTGPFGAHPPGSRGIAWAREIASVHPAPTWREHRTRDFRWLLDDFAADERSLPPGQGFGDRLVPPHPQTVRGPVGLRLVAFRVPLPRPLPPASVTTTAGLPHFLPRR